MDGRASPGVLNTSRPVRIWIYDAQTRQERDVMEMAPEFGPEGTNYYRVPVVLFFGIADAGVDDRGRPRHVPTVLRTYGKLPYMYTRAPDAWQGVEPSKQDLERVAQRLDDALWERLNRPWSGGRRLQDENDADTTGGVVRKTAVRKKGLGNATDGRQQSALEWVGRVAVERLAGGNDNSDNGGGNDNGDNGGGNDNGDNGGGNDNGDNGGGSVNSGGNIDNGGGDDGSGETDGSGSPPPVPPGVDDEAVQRVIDAAGRLFGALEERTPGDYQEWVAEALSICATRAHESAINERKDATRVQLELDAIDDDHDARRRAAAAMVGELAAMESAFQEAMAAWQQRANLWVFEAHEAAAFRDYVDAVSASNNGGGGGHSRQGGGDPLDATVGDDAPANDGKAWARRRVPYVHSVEWVHMPTTKRYGAAESFLRVTLTAPNLVTTLRSLLWTPVSSKSTPTCTVRQEDKRPPVLRFDDAAGTRHALPQDDLAECKIEFYMRYMIDQRIEMCEWLEVSGAEFMDEHLCAGNETTAFLAARHDAVHTLSPDQCKAMPPPEFIECGMDIETRNTVIWADEAKTVVRGARFPNAEVPDNSVQCICLALHPNGEAMRASAAERRRCVEEGLKWSDRDGDRKRILKRQRQAELSGGWYEAFYWGNVNEERVRHLRAEKPVRFYRAADEFTMIKMFCQRIKELRAEMPLTWNGNAFDVPYLSDRVEKHYASRKDEVFNVAEMVGAVSDWAARRENWAAEVARFQSKQAGKRGGRDIRWPSVAWHDIMQTVIKNYKFRSYKLDWVAEFFLGEHKDDMDPAQITPTWDRDADGAADVVSYCCWDAELPWRIAQVNKLTEDMMQMARVTKVPPQALMTRGQSIKSYIQIVTTANRRGFLVHHHEAPPSAFDAKRTEAKFKGAVVIEPIKGFYPQPVIVLDFSSLYPSEAISHNLCYTTWVPPQYVASVPEEDRFCTPAGHWFVKKRVRAGLVPEALSNLLGERKTTRNASTKAEEDGDVATATSLDKRQLNYKVSANSIYGFMGSDASLPCFAVSESITAYGREDIMAVKALIESTYRGYFVVYGDTDSVMIATPRGTAVADAIATMHEMAALVNKRFKEDADSVMSITAEKVYTNYLLLSKKRYAGMYWTKPDAPDKLDTKGMENVRRDFAPVTSEVVAGILERIVRRGSVDEAADFARQVIGSVVSGTVPFEKLVISKKFSRSAKDYATPQPHVTVNERVARRDPGREKLEGDRIEYVITAGRGKTFERAEDPRYIRENGIPIDYQYYYEKQIRKPIWRLFRRVMHEQHIEDEIFNGPHMRRRAAAPVRKDAGGIGQFVTISARPPASSTAAATTAAAAALPTSVGATTAAPPRRRVLTNDASCLSRFVQPVADRAAATAAEVARFAALPPAPPRRRMRALTNSGGARAAAASRPDPAGKKRTASGGKAPAFKASTPRWLTDANMCAQLMPLGDDVVDDAMDVDDAQTPLNNNDDELLYS